MQRALSGVMQRALSGMVCTCLLYMQIGCQAEAFNHTASGLDDAAGPGSSLSVHKSAKSVSAAKSKAAAVLDLAMKPFTSLDDVYASEPQGYRGLRARFVVVCGPVTTRLASRSTGRATYSGKAVSKLHKLLRAASPGQMLVQGAVLRAPSPFGTSMQPKHSVDSPRTPDGPHSFFSPLKPAESAV